MPEATIEPVSSRAPLKILVVMEHPGIGTLMPALKLLHDRGHHVCLAYESTKSVESHLELKALVDECPGIAFAQLPSIDPSGWGVVSNWLRRSIDYVRYLEPHYRDAKQLRKRASRKAPKRAKQLGRIAGRAGPKGVAALFDTLRVIEQSAPPPPEIERFLAGEPPDVLLPTHLLPIGTPHAGYLRAAKRLGLHTVFPVRGWDNLTNKGVLKDAPELMLVWNEFQAQEAEQLHRVPREHIQIMGAALCDHWFGWQPSRDRETFCRQVGLRADRPIVLYMCSSGFVARNNEAVFVESWIERLRARGGSFAEAGFLVRPHPLNAAQWADFALDGEQVRVWPRFGEAPHDDASRQNFFDSIYHAAGVVGINTTSQIESAIVGRPVHTLLADEFKDTQQGTLHFQYLKADELGHLYVGRTFEEHAEQLEASLRGREEDGRNERFLRRFVRPLGLDRSATEEVVHAIEELGARPAPVPDHGPGIGPVVRLALAPVAAVAGRRLERRAAATKAGGPGQELRRLVRTRVMHRAGMPVIAGPWQGDELGELLYWIPVLRRAQTTAPGLHQRLFVIARRASLRWYDGVGAERLAADELFSSDELAELAADSEDELQGSFRSRLAEVFDLGSRAFRVLPAEAVEAARSDLAGQTPTMPDQLRLLEFAQLAAPGPNGAEPPDDVLGVAGAGAGAEVATLIAERKAVVGLDELDRQAQTAVLGRARGFVGGFGVEACLALMLGRPAVVCVQPGTESDELRVASSFLASPPFGPLHVVELDGPVEETAERAVQLVESAEALAAV
jgi:hypothetical protein